MIVASRLTNGRVRLSISLTLANRSRDLRAPISRSCHSLPGSSSILVLAFVRAKESNLNRYRRKRISPISNIIDSKKKKYHRRIPTFHDVQVLQRSTQRRVYIRSCGGRKGGKTLDLEVNNIVASNNVAAMSKSHVSRLPPSPNRFVISAASSRSRLVDRRTFSRVYRGEPRIPPNQLRSYISGGVATHENKLTLMYTVRPMAAGGPRVAPNPNSRATLLRDVIVIRYNKPRADIPRASRSPP